MADSKQDDPNPPNDVVHAAELHDIGEEGSDMTRDIFMALFSNKERAAARSMPDVSEVLYEDIGKASEMAQPGGFRRGHVLASRGGGANGDGSGNNGDGSPSYAHASFLDSFASLRAGRNAVKSSYDDFIIANLGYGMSREDFYDEDDDGEANTPLVRHHVTKTTTKAGLQVYKTFSSDDDESESRGASVRKTVFTILKSFIGSGILFLPKAFQHGGMLFSIVGLFISASLSTFCMLRLTDCSNAVMRATGGGSGSGVSYGLLGERSFGKWGRLAVNVSLVLSQLGFCCSYLIFVEKNIGDIIAQVFHTNDSVASFSWTLILLQIPLYTPLTWVRRIEYFAITNLIADVLILFGLIYIIGYSIEKLEAAPPRSSTWENFNSRSWALFLGTAVYCFEGIGLILPIYDAMDAKIKHKFPKIIALTILFLVVLFSLFAGIVYAAFGEDTQSVVTLNLPNASVSGATMTVQLTYSLALVLTYPLMLYPVVKILENYVFAQRRVKGYWRWQKNGFRFVLVCLTAAIAFFGKNQLDNFVALIGGFCSVPLAFIYPCLFHSRLVNNGHWLNAAVIVIGAFTMVFASYQALTTWS